MRSERWERAWSLFEEALERPPEERSALLDQECAGDPSLRRAVENWLRADGQAASFLEDGLVAAHAEPIDLVGRQLGPFQVLGKLGQGGMGTVYLGHQKDETFDRQVAIKVLTTASFTREARRRFRTERRLLASLDHPAVARVFAGGATREGIPYLVLEYVPGMEIDRYCDSHELGLEERIHLFRQVCEAVSAAHRNLIAHRDLKPSNVLVREDGQPKLLDFGIAKLLGEGAEEEGTRSWSRPLTPRFASPEQIRGETISASTDVFSLGVLLYLLLCGELPFETSGNDLQALLQEIEAGPQPPSQRLRDDAVRARRLRGDLDSIVLRALRPKPAERYRSVDDLNEDLARYLDGRSVEARRGNWRYRAGKFLSRHRWPLALLATVFAGLVTVAVILSVSGARLQQESNDLETVVSLLIEMVQKAGPLVTEGIDRSLLGAVQRFDQAVMDTERLRPAVRSRLLGAIGQMYLALGHQDDALRLFLADLELERQRSGEQGAEYARRLDWVGAAHREANRIEEAEAANQAALELLKPHRSAPPETLAQVLNNQITLLCWRQDFAAALPISRRVLALARERLEPNDPELGISLGQHALVLSMTADLEGSIPYYQEHLEFMRRVHGELHPDLPATFNNLARVLAQQGDREAAITALKEADTLFARIYSESFYDRVIPLLPLARFALEDGDVDQAITWLLKAAEIGRETDVPSYILRPALSFGRVLLAEGRCVLAEEQLRLSLEVYPEDRERGPLFHEVTCLLARSLDCLGRGQEARNLRRRSVAAFADLEGSLPEACSVASS